MKADEEQREQPTQMCYQQRAACAVQVVDAVMDNIDCYDDGNIRGYFGGK